MPRTLITTKQVSRLIGKSPRTVQWYVQTQPSFPEPERKQGVAFLHDLEKIEAWMRDRQMKPQRDRADILREIEAYYTTTQILALLELKNSKGNRAHLAKQIRAGRFPAPSIMRRGNQGENLWDKRQFADHIVQRGFAARWVSRPPDRVILPTELST